MLGNTLAARMEHDDASQVVNVIKNRNAEDRGTDILIEPDTKKSCNAVTTTINPCNLSWLRLC